MRKLFDRYADTVLYILNLLTLIALVVTTIQLKGEVRTMERALVAKEKEVEVTPEVRIMEEVDRPEYHVEAAWPRLYTDDDAIALAKMLYGEARGVPELVLADGSKITSQCQQAAVIWTVLNRYDAGYEDTIEAVVEAPRQYHGHSTTHPVEDELLELAYDVLDRWNREKHGETNVGRVLPRDHYWFHGDGTYNYFRNEYKSSSYWTWELPDVYALWNPPGFND